MACRFFEASDHAAAYAMFRPEPPQSVIDTILVFLREKYRGPLSGAADVGCGGGHSTFILAPHFNCVTGLDISQAQITEANKKNTACNVSFKVSKAEDLPFEKESLQLITTGQACHWFDMVKFYTEVDRVLVSGGIVALYSYLLPVPMYGDASQHKLANIVYDMFEKELDGYHHNGSKESYFENYKSEKYTMIYEDKMEVRNGVHFSDKTVTVTDLAGYVSTWAGFQYFRSQNGDEAALKLLDEFQNRIMSVLGVNSKPEDTQLTLRYKYFIIMGRKP